MNSRPVTATIRVSTRTSPKKPYTPIKESTEVISHIMSNSKTNITVGVGMTYPEILGPYSSMNVHVSMEIPADTKGISDQAALKAVLDPYRDMVSEYVMTNINEACKQVGKDAPFGDL